MSDTATCSTCGVPAGQDWPVFRIVDELGRGEICWTCLLTLVARTRATWEVTVFVARPTAIPQN